MALSSMTGFARGQGVSGPYAWAWELKSVNAKGLDLRLRLPPGWDAVEAPVRARAAEALARGTVYGNLTVEREGVAPAVQVNEPVLAAVLATLIERLERPHRRGAAERSTAFSALKGVIEVSDRKTSARRRSAAEAAVVAGFDKALDELVAMRREEGAALGRMLIARLDEIAALTARAEAAPGRQAGGDQGAACRADRDAARRHRALRSRPPASGGDAARQQGRHPRGARPAGVRMSRRRASCSPTAVRSGGGSTFWRRNSTANRIRFAPRRMTSSSPISGSN